MSSPTPSIPDDDVDKSPTAGRYGYHGHHHGGSGGSTAGAHDVRDPVCDAMLDPHTAPENAGFGGAVYHFCSPRCRSAFEANPARYATLTPGGLAPQDSLPRR
jgi:YHS domain-containing protein